MTAPQTQEAPQRRPSRAWTAVGVLGELLITFGVVLLLFVAYQLLWTNVTAQRAAGSAAAELQDSWSQPSTVDDGSETDTEEQPELPQIGDAFALMFIPRLADKVWGTPVLESVDLSDLARGIGHYPQTQLPGQKGNFAVAAHRATNGEPFRDIDQLQVGDKVYVETQDHWYEYTLRRDEIVAPQATWVLDPVPGDAGAEAAERLITLTTCNPRWGQHQPLGLVGGPHNALRQGRRGDPPGDRGGPVDVRLDLEPPARADGAQGAHLRPGIRGARRRPLHLGLPMARASAALHRRDRGWDVVHRVIHSWGRNYTVVICLPSAPVPSRCADASSSTFLERP